MKKRGKNNRIKEKSGDMVSEYNKFRISVDRTSKIDKIEEYSEKKVLHEDMEIKCFYEGSATIVVEGNTFSVGAGDIVVINPYEFHATVETGEQKGKYHLFMIPLDYFSTGIDLHKLFFKERKMFRTLFSNNKELYSILSRAADEIRRGELCYELVIKGLLTEFFVMLLRYGISENEFPVSQKSTLRLYSQIEPALKCIKDEYSKELTLDHLATLCNVSRHYFCHIFKSVTGKSAMEYLREHRLSIADIMLHNTNSGVGEIAMLCGFESANYFSRMYKRVYGISPRQNRNKK